MPREWRDYIGASVYDAVMQLEQGKSYRADLSLGMLESMASNETVAEKFRGLGFTNVVVTGSGSKRQATGTWPLGARAVEMPKQVVSVSVVG